MGRNSYGQLTNDQGELVYEFGPNAGKTASQVQGAAVGGGAGSSTSYDSASGQSVSTQTPNMIPQETDQQVTLQNNQARLSADAARQKAQLDAEAEARRLSNLRSMWTTGSAGPVVSGEPTADETAARGAAFARAKDTAGASALASLKALEDVMAERGLRDSSIEGNGTANILSGAAGQIGEQVRSQMIGDAQRAAQIADRNYAGAITQRGQNMQQQQSLLSLFGSGVY